VPPPPSTQDAAVARPRNDPRQYDDLVEEWWRPRGAFAMLHWIAEARARLVPPAPHTDALLVDIACGAGLLAPHLAGKGYRHIGVDRTATALACAALHGVTPLQGDALQIPLADGCADLVCAGEILEHVADLEGAVAEACRVLRPGGRLVIDTLAATARARWLAVTLAERVGAVPHGIHDPALFVDRRRLVAAAARHGVALELRGLRPSVPGLLTWWLGGSTPVRMVPQRSTGVLFQAWGTRVEGG
jgi:2-polyprenyl-6-hydroxyphenyl methylase/3-demethylubiquinone-9 3-methyltransferase